MYALFLSLLIYLSQTVKNVKTICWPVCVLVIYYELSLPLSAQGTNAQNMTLRWGIASAGKISSDFVVALKALPTTDHQVVAVAARSQASADKFGSTHNITTTYEGYNKLAQDSNVDVVYIGVINTQHYDVAKLMLENGKHVLCEKPFTMNEKQTRKLIEISKAKKLFLMEAVWSRCFPVYKELKKIIDSGEIGEVVQTSVEFGFPIIDVDRINSKALGGGATLDLGVYVLQFQQYVFRGLKPLKVVASGHLNEDGIDSSVSSIITYPKGKTAVATASALVKLSGEGIIYGTKGYIKIFDMWCPTDIEVNGKLQKFPLIENKGHFNFKNSAGLAYEAEEVRKCIKEGKLESPQITHNETIQLAQLMDKLRQDVGVVFPADLEAK